MVGKKKQTLLPKKRKSTTKDTANTTSKAAVAATTEQMHTEASSKQAAATKKSGHKKSPPAVKAAAKKDDRKQAPVAAPTAATSTKQPPSIPDPLNYDDLDANFIKREVVENERTIVVKHNDKEMLLFNPMTAYFGCVFCQNASDCVHGTANPMQVSGIGNHFKRANNVHKLEGETLSTKNNKQEWAKLVHYKAPAPPDDSDEFKELKALKKSLFEGSFPVGQGKGVPKSKITKDSMVVSKKDYVALCELSGMSCIPPVQDYDPDSDGDSDDQQDRESKSASGDLF